MIASGATDLLIISAPIADTFLAQPNRSVLIISKVATDMAFFLFLFSVDFLNPLSAIPLRQNQLSGRGPTRIRPPQNVLFLCNTGSYSRGWTLINAL
jgi:hypothetical protein